MPPIRIITHYSIILLTVSTFFVNFCVSCMTHATTVSVLKNALSNRPTNSLNPHKTKNHPEGWPLVVSSSLFGDSDQYEVLSTQLSGTVLLP